jgi:hypothetical protein
VIRRLALAIAACAALLAAGCGGGGGGGGTGAFTGPDPATLTPADAPLFAEAVVRPEGDQKEALQGALSKLLATDDPGGFLIDKLNKELAVPGSKSGLTYARDIEPWLGGRAGIFVTGFKRDQEGAPVVQGASLVATTDPAATQQAIDKAEAADPTGNKKRTYRGVDYELDRRGQAAGLVGDLLVVGSNQAFREAVDASHGQSLAESSQFKDELDQAPDDQVAFAYADPGAFVDALEKTGQLTASDVRAAGPQLQGLLSQPATASISATSDQLALQVSAAQSKAAPAPQASSMLSDFPSDSWFAFAASDAGRSVGQALSAAAPGPLARALGAGIGRWAGEIGGFARGTSLFGIGGALVIKTTDERASARTLDSLERVLSRDPSVDVSPLSTSGEHGFSLSPSGLPAQFQFVQRDGEVAAGLADSINDVFSPSSRLSDSEAFKAATGALGSDFAPITFIDFGPLFQLVDGFPQAAHDPGYRSAKPYLDHLKYLILGDRSTGDSASARVVLGLQDAPSAAGAGGSQSPATLQVP